MIPWISCGRWMKERVWNEQKSNNMVFFIAPSLSKKEKIFLNRKHFVQASLLLQVEIITSTYAWHCMMNALYCVTNGYFGAIIKKLICCTHLIHRNEHARSGHMSTEQLPRHYKMPWRRKCVRVLSCALPETKCIEYVSKFGGNWAENRLYVY